MYKWVTCTGVRCEIGMCFWHIPFPPETPSVSGVTARDQPLLMVDPGAIRVHFLAQGQNDIMLSAQGFDPESFGLLAQRS